MNEANGDSTARSGARSIVDDARCPCLSGETYGACCGQSHTGAVSAPTAERLMRSRFCAFAIADAAYLLATWHPRTRPRTLDLDPAQRWGRLEIIRSIRGGMLDTQGTVEFRAHYRLASVAGVQHEVSRFVRKGGHWFYLDGVVAGP